MNVKNICEKPMNLLVENLPMLTQFFFTCYYLLLSASMQDSDLHLEAESYFISEALYF